MEIDEVSKMMQHIMMMVEVVEEVIMVDMVGPKMLEVAEVALVSLLEKIILLCPLNLSENFAMRLVVDLSMQYQV